MYMYNIMYRYAVLRYMYIARGVLKLHDGIWCAFEVQCNTILHTCTCTCDRIHTVMNHCYWQTHMSCTCVYVRPIDFYYMYMYNTYKCMYMYMYMYLYLCTACKVHVHVHVYSILLQQQKSDMIIYRECLYSDHEKQTTSVRTNYLNFVL